MDGDRATFSCEFNSLLRHPDDVQFSSEPELQITSDTGLVWYKRNHNRTAHICHPRLLMGFEFREVGNSGKKLQSDHYLNKYSQKLNGLVQCYIVTLLQWTILNVRCILSSLQFSVCFYQLEKNNISLSLKYPFIGFFLLIQLSFKHFPRIWGKVLAV